MNEVSNGGALAHAPPAPSSPTPLAAALEDNARLRAALSSVVEFARYLEDPSALVAKVAFTEVVRIAESALADTAPRRRHAQVLELIDAALASAEVELAGHGQ